MVRIFVVDNGGQWTHREWRVLKYLGVDTRIVPNSTPVPELEAAAVDGLLLSGGAPRVGLADALGLCGEYLDRLKVPVLGICAGHQFMARHFGGEVQPGQGEFGSTQLRLQDGAADAPLFHGVPTVSTVWESHHDDVVRAPDGFQVLASSERCPIQAMQHAIRPLYGVQFHPEVEHSEHGALMLRNFVNLCQGAPG